MDSKNNAIGHVAVGKGPYWGTVHIVPGGGNAEVWVRFGDYSPAHPMGWAMFNVNGVWSDMFFTSQEVEGYAGGLSAANLNTMALGVQVLSDSAKNSAADAAPLKNPDGSCTQALWFGVAVETISTCFAGLP